MKSFLLKNQVQARGIKKTPKDEWMKASFKISLNEGDFEKVFTPGFWPKGVQCREWIGYVPPVPKSDKKAENSQPVEEVNPTTDDRPTE
jgi:hypothetical protein